LALEHEYWVTLDGCLPIARQGCALRATLIVSAPLRGMLWDDLRIDQCGLRPMLDTDGHRLGFDAWLSFQLPNLYLLEAR
jgi:hypothetical protein